MIVTGNKFPAASLSSWGTKLCHLVVPVEFAPGKEISEWSTELKTFLNGMYENNTWDGASGIRITTTAGDVYVGGKISE